MVYSLHDFFLTRMTMKKDKITFCFPEGYYAVNDKGKEIKPKKLLLTIDTGKYAVKNFISVRMSKCTNRGYTLWKDVPLRKFLRLLKKGSLIFFDEYDSKLTNAKMFQLNTSDEHKAGYNIELFITDILSVECD